MGQFGLVENAHWPRMNEVQAIRQVAIDFQPVESEIFLILQVENQLQPV